MARQKMKTTVVKAVVLLACLFMALPAMSANRLLARAQKKPCGIVAQATGPLLVMEGRDKVIPISFRVGGAAQEVRFFISGRDRAKGITMPEKTVKVKDGVASSSLSFKVSNGMPLGRHSMAIEIFDAGRGAKICTVTVPYILLPGTECMCMETRRENKAVWTNYCLIKTKKHGRNENA